MSLLNHILDDPLSHLLPAALALAVAAFFCGLIILRRRLPRSSHSCEGQTTPELSQKRSNTRTDTSLPSTLPNSEHTPLNSSTQADSQQDSEDEMPRRPRQLYDAFLVLDVEATCVKGAGFDYPNEIIASRYH